MFQAVLWSIVASFTIVQEGYDTLLLGSLFGLPAFKKYVSDFSRLPPIPALRLA